MDQELKHIVNQVAQGRKLKMTSAAIEHLEKYDNQWKGTVRKKWNSSLIQAVLANTAIKFAEKTGRDEIDEDSTQKAILEWHEGEPDSPCLSAGLNIMNKSQESDFAKSLNPGIAAFVKNIIS